MRAASTAPRPSEVLSRSAPPSPSTRTTRGGSHEPYSPPEHSLADLGDLEADRAPEDVRDLVGGALVGRIGGSLLGVRVGANVGWLVGLYVGVRVGPYGGPGAGVAVGIDVASSSIT